MKQIYLQARSDHGYLIHAINEKASRSGLHEQYINGRPICGKVAGRANGFSTMRLVYPGWEDRIPEVFTAAMLQTADKPICVKCATRVAQAASH